MINIGSSGTKRYGAPGLASQAEPLLLQIPPQNNQDVDNFKEDQQDQKSPPLCLLSFVKSHKRPCSTKVKHPGVSISKPSDTRPGDMTSIDHMVYEQLGMNPQVTADLTNVRFWEAVVFVILGEPHLSKPFKTMRPLRS